jgi:peptidoglycan/LPS O-acetylase OafA/YrhL
VLISHSFAIAGRSQPAVGVLDLGTIGVLVFFGISGYLIAQSWTADPHVWRYLAKRALRILPALVVTLSVTTLVVGALFTSLPARDYFSRAETWWYLLKNALLVTTDALPGLFQDTPDARVNASLWTLRVEALAYLGIIAVGAAGGLRTRRWLPLVLTAVVFAAPHAVGGLAALPELFVVRAFCVGTCLYVFRDLVPWHWTIALVALLVWVVAPPSAQWLAGPVVIPYVTILFGFRGPGSLRRLTSRGDLSYGIYLFAWPVGQALAAMWGPSITPAAVIAIGLPVTYALASLSWKLVERPALAGKKHLIGRSGGPRVPSGALPQPLAQLQQAKT